MLTKKTADLPGFCADPKHDPPMHLALRPGHYEHTCRTCGRVVHFTVFGTTTRWDALRSVSPVPLLDAGSP